MGLNLGGNQISSIESDDFNGLANLRGLSLGSNRLSGIESGAFSALTKLENLWLGNNTDLTELNFEAADFSNLNDFAVSDNMDITSVSLNSSVVNQTSFAALLVSGYGGPAIGDLDGITEMDLSGIDFANITNLEPLYVMDDLTSLWLANTTNLDAYDLDALLDTLATIEILHMTQSDYDAFNTAGDRLLEAWDAEPGHHVAIVPEPTSTVLLLTFSSIALVRCRMRRW